MAGVGTLTWQVIASALAAIAGVLLIAGAFSPDNPAPPPAILGTGVLLVVLALWLLKLHLSFVRRMEEG